MRKAFTLVELLVVIGIIAVLLSILLPTTSMVRQSANRTVCQSNLRDIGAQFRMYFDDNHDRLPEVNTMPSIRPPLTTAPPIQILLQPYNQKATGVFRCPSDWIKSFSTNSMPGDFNTYFDREGSSYQYNPMLSERDAGKQLKETWAGRSGRLDTLFLLTDFEPFHGQPGKHGSANYLFADQHIGDLN